MLHSFTPAHPSLAGTDPVDALRLIRSENVGPVTFFQLLKYFGTPSRALEEIPNMARRGGKKQIVICSKAEAEKELEATRKFGARIALYGDADYPKLLTTVSDAPPVISVRGHPHLYQQKDTIAIVGARNASANGCHFAQKLAADLGKHRLAVVSGLARGVDTAAHKGALKEGTVGVIAGGIDNIYPPENKMLYEAIAETGAIISELPFGAMPHARSFPGRNRIISGMSLGVIVVEASLKSGSLITARFAGEQGREVFAVPGSPMDPRCTGTNGLIKDGATLTESIDDILPALNSLRGSSLGEMPPASFKPSPVALDEKELAGTRAAVLEKLGYHPVLVDELIAQCHVTPHIVLAILLELELAGRLNRHAGGRVSLAAEESLKAIE